MGNLGFYKDGDEYIVVLLDFDCAVFASSAENATQRLTGTVPFIARDILRTVTDPDVKFKHSLRHDLESIFYVIIYYGLGYTAACTRKGQPDWLLKWHTGTYAEICDAKQRFFSEYRPEELEHVESTFLRGLIMALHWKYYERSGALQAAQYKLDKERYEKIKKEAQIAKDEALKCGKSLLEANQIYWETECSLRKITQKEKVQEPSAISFKQLMTRSLGAVSEVHNGCTCCRDDSF